MLYSAIQTSFGGRKVQFRPKSGKIDFQLLKTHELKYMETVKDGSQIDVHLIFIIVDNIRIFLAYSIEKINLIIYHEKKYLVKK